MSLVQLNGDFVWSNLTISTSKNEQGNFTIHTKGAKSAPVFLLEKVKVYNQAIYPKGKLNSREATCQLRMAFNEDQVNAMKCADQYWLSVVKGDKKSYMPTGIETDKWIESKQTLQVSEPRINPTTMKPYKASFSIRIQMKDNESTIAILIDHQPGGRISDITESCRLTVAITPTELWQRPNGDWGVSWKTIRVNKCTDPLDEFRFPGEVPLSAPMPTPVVATAVNMVDSHAGVSAPPQDVLSNPVMKRFSNSMDTATDRASKRQRSE